MKEEESRPFFTLGCALKSSESALGVVGKELTLGFFDNRELEVIIYRQSCAEFHHCLLVVFIEEEYHSPGMEVPGDIVFRLFDSAIDVLQSLPIHS